MDELYPLDEESEVVSVGPEKEPVDDLVLGDVSDISDVVEIVDVVLAKLDLDVNDDMVDKVLVDLG